MQQSYDGVLTVCGQVKYKDFSMLPVYATNKAEMDRTAEQSEGGVRTARGHIAFGAYPDIGHELSLAHLAVRNLALDQFFTKPWP